MDSVARKISWNPFVAGYFNNPYPHLHECREHNPIHKGILNSWMFFEHETVSNIVRSDNFLVSDLSAFFKEKEPAIFNGTGCPFLSQGTKLWPMYINGGSHKRVRAAMGKGFSEFSLEDIFDSSIRATNKQFTAGKEFDLVSYCGNFIFRVIEQFFQIDNYESYNHIKKYSNLLAKSQDVYVPKQVYQEINESMLWGKNIFNNSEYKTSVENSLKDMNCSEDDIYSIMSVSLMAAFETSKDSLSIALYEILRNPDLEAFVLNANQSEINILVEELFRFASPLNYTIRVNKDPLYFAEGIEVEPGSKLFLCLASANRDPKVFDSPDSVIPDRSLNPHLAFGGGVHFCLGASIARQELRFCLKPMVQFLKEYTPDESKAVKWGKQIFMRTAESVALKSKYV